MMEFSNKLKQIRKERGMTQTDLAQMIGVSKSLISNYEAGLRHRIAFPIQVSIANALGCSLEDLGWSDATEKHTYVEKHRSEAALGIPRIKKFVYEWDDDKCPHCSIRINGQKFALDEVTDFVIHQKGPYKPSLIIGCLNGNSDDDVQVMGTVAEPEGGLNEKETGNEAAE